MSCTGLRSLVISVCLALIGLAAPQGIEPGEVRVTSGPYRPRPKYTVTVDTKLVEVGVVVRDQRGKAVAGLTREDFEITDEGRKRPLAAFSVETSVPDLHPADTKTEAGPTPSTKLTQRYVALLFDDTSMGPGELFQVQSAARRFVTDGFKQGDHLALFTTSGTQNLPFTTDTAKLLGAIDNFHVISRMPGSGGCPAMTAYEAYVIANRIDIGVFNNKLREAAKCAGLPPPGDVDNFEGRSSVSSGRVMRLSAPAPPKQIVDGVKAQANSIWAQVRQTAGNTMGAIADVVDYMAQMPEQRIILLASSGFLSGTLEQEFDEITRHAIHAGVVVNALDAKGLYTDEPLPRNMGTDPRSLTRMQAMGTISNDAANDAAASLAYNTGGLFFHNNNDLDLGFRELGVRPEVRYLLAFEPDDHPDGKYHKLKVRLTGTNRGNVQARLGYVAVPEAPVPSQPQRRIDIEAAATDVLEEAPANITAMPALTDSGEIAVKAVFHLDIKRLHFTEEGGVRQQKVSLIAVVTDKEGNFVAGKEGTVQLVLKESTYSLLCRNGMNASLMLPVLAGTYRLRGVLQESVDGKVTASTEILEVH
jgi:VWFA-related protein